MHLNNEAYKYKPFSQSGVDFVALKFPNWNKVLLHLIMIFCDFLEQKNEIILCPEKSDISNLHQLQLAASMRGFDEFMTSENIKTLNKNSLPSYPMNIN